MSAKREIPRVRVTLRLEPEMVARINYATKLGESFHTTLVRMIDHALERMGLPGPGR